MMMKKNVLSVAVAASIGMLAASQASAVTTYGSELPAASVFTGVAPSFNLTTPFAPTAANPLYIQIALTNGASFNAVSSVKLYCDNTASDTATTAAMVTLAAGGVGTANATFVITASSASTQLSACYITTADLLAGTNMTIGANITLTYGNALAATGTITTALTTGSSFFANAATANTNTALVSSGFISFSTANAVAGSDADTARIGQFTLAEVAGVLQTTGESANAIGVTAFVTAITVSLAGDVLAAAKANSGALFITYDSAVAAGSATCAGTKIVSAIGGAANITFSAVSPDIGGGATSAYKYAVCMTVTGATIPEGTITFGVVGTPNNDGNHANGSAYQISTLIASGTTLGTITHDGATTTVVNLPPSTNADAGYLRVYNTSNLAGAVTATIYSEAGTALASNCSLSSSLAANSTLVTSAAAMETTCGITPPATGRYRVVVNGAFSTMRAQGLARTGGVLVNLSADSSSNSN